MPEQFRMAVLLADVEGFSYKEIAEIMDVPIGTVMSRLHRGRKQLQKRLWDFGRRAAGLSSRAGSARFGTRPGHVRLGTTMDCDKAIHQVYSYLDGELTGLAAEDDSGRHPGRRARRARRASTSRSSCAR